ncbi:hypothetical protein [Paracoccus cavernae]
MPHINFGARNDEGYDLAADDDAEEDDDFTDAPHGFDQSDAYDHEEPAAQSAPLFAPRPAERSALPKAPRAAPVIHDFDETARPPYEHPRSSCCPHRTRSNATSSPRSSCWKTRVPSRRYWMITA